jgi:hypothetical protein
MRIVWFLNAKVQFAVCTAQYRLAKSKERAGLKNDSPCYPRAFCERMIVLLSCPTCGYALSMQENRCRHCPASSGTGRWFKTFHTRSLVHVGLMACVLALLVYWFYAF